LEVLPATTFKIFTVNQEEEIRPFVEGKTKKPYVQGSAYYLLTKREKIQEGKELLLQDRATTQVFGDSQRIRQQLGLPTAGDIRVNPGNHANWNLFVQSTSVNRKLVRGSKVLVIK